MKVLLTGAAGQLGQALISAKPAAVELIATTRAGGPDQQPLDLGDPAACRRAVLEQQPDWVLNAGAYTQVDQAEREPELARRVNADAPAALAEALAETGGRLLQISTDFVFNGQQGAPYRTDQQPAPLGVYGATKAAGETAARRLPGARVLRTGWVYGPVGHNFCLTMLRLQRQCAAEARPLRVVADQVGCPTSTETLAQACWRAMGIGADVDGPAVLHWSDAGAASWYDFAVAIAELAVQVGLLETSVVVEPIATADYPTPAQRPSYSLLDCDETRRHLNLQPVHWRNQLLRTLRSRSALISPP